MTATVRLAQRRRYLAVLVAWMVGLTACAAVAAVPATRSAAARATHVVARDAPLTQLSAPGHLLRDHSGGNSLLGPPAAILPGVGVLLVLLAIGYLPGCRNRTRGTHRPDRPTSRAPPVSSPLLRHPPPAPTSTGMADESCSSGGVR